MPKCRVGVAVLGDLGRSPRMQYHAHSLARHGHPVHLVGYPGSPLPDSLATNTNVTVRHRECCSVMHYGRRGFSRAYQLYEHHFCMFWASN